MMLMVAMVMILFSVCLWLLLIEFYPKDYR